MFLIKIDVAGSRSQTKRNHDTAKREGNGKKIRLNKEFTQRKCR